MTRTFVSSNPIKVEQIFNYFNYNLNVDIDEIIEDEYHHITVSSETFSPQGKMAADLIKQVERLFNSDNDVDIM